MIPAPTGSHPLPSSTIGGLPRSLAANWWALMVRGLMALLLGLVALVAPLGTIGAFVLVAAAYLVVDGALAVVAAVRAAQRGERWWLLVLEGVAGLAAGVIALTLPAVTIVAFVWLLAGWALVSGGLMLAAAFRLRGAGRWWLGLSGLLSLVWGVLLATSPIAGAVVLTLWFGAYALLFGGLMLALAFHLRGLHRAHPPRPGTPLTQAPHARGTA